MNLLERINGGLNEKRQGLFWNHIQGRNSKEGGGGGGRIVITDKRVLQCLTNLLFIIHMKFHQNLGKGNYKGMIHQRSVLVYPFTSKLIITNFK